MKFVKIKSKNKLKLIKLIVPAGMATVSSSIGPLLGQVGLSAVEFSNAFNERTWFVEQGVPLLVDLFFYPGKRDFTFEVKGPFMSSVLYDVVTNNNTILNNVVNLDLNTMYKIAFLKTNNKFLVKSVFFNLFGTLKSYNLN